MGALLSLYIGLAVFGAGVTLVDLLGFLGHGHDDGDAQADAGADGHDGDGDGHDEDSGDLDADAAGGSDHDAASDDDADAGHDGHAEGDSGAPAHYGPEGGEAHGGGSMVRADQDGSLLAIGSLKAKRVARFLAFLRIAVSFSLGFGPMGAVALLSKQGIVPSLLWASISGFLMAALARGLRRLLRKELDSSIKEEEFILQTGEVTVPIEEGKLGKLRIRLYGRETEVFAHAESGSLRKGELAVVTGYANGVYTVRGALALPDAAEIEKKE